MIDNFVTFLNKQIISNSTWNCKHQTINEFNWFYCNETQEAPKTPPDVFHAVDVSLVTLVSLTVFMQKMWLWAISNTIMFTCYRHVYTNKLLLDAISRANSIYKQGKLTFIPINNQCNHVKHNSTRVFLPGTLNITSHWNFVFVSLIN